MDEKNSPSPANASPVPAKKTPVPVHPEPDQDWPKCPRCDKRIDEARHLDYGERYRVVFHTNCGGVLGVLPMPPEEDEE